LQIIGILPQEISGACPAVRKAPLSSMLFPGTNSKAHIMKKYLVAAVLVAAFASPRSC
jgi:hypothetical protein